MESDLTELDIRAGIAGHVIITAVSKDGDKFVGLLSPDVTKELGRICFEEAVKAELTNETREEHDGRRT